MDRWWRSPDLRRALAVCALGTFIDVFDIQLFGVLRVASLSDLGVPADRLAAIGGYILNAQMTGMFAGGLLWGWLGDRYGRLKALYGSILIYSLGTLGCAFVQDSFGYGLWRAIAGFGLAGEVGAAFTLIAESMTPRSRGWGVVAISTIGWLGPVLAIILSWFMPWRTTYIVAAALGLLILVLRIRLGESRLFAGMAENGVLRGSWRLLLRREQGCKLLLCTCISLPQTYFWFLMNFYSAEFARAILTPDQPFVQKTAQLFFFIGTACGDLLSGSLSQWARSRRKPLAAAFMLGGAAALTLLLLGSYIKFPLACFYALYFILGLAGGSMVLVGMIFAESFGTNIRATTTIVMFNVARGMSVLMIFGFLALQQGMSAVDAASMIGVAFIMLGLIGLWRLPESYGLDLDYVERLDSPRLSHNGT